MQLVNVFEDLNEILLNFSNTVVFIVKEVVEI